MPLFVGSRRTLLTPKPVVVSGGGGLPMTGLLRRYVASSGMSTTTDGAMITTWTDTVAGKVLTNVGSKSGLTYVASALNGKPGEVDTGASNVMAESAYDSAINVNETTAVVVWKHTYTTEGGTGPLFHLYDPSGKAGIFMEYSGSMNVYAFVGHTTDYDGPSGYTDAGDVFHTAVMTASRTAGQVALYVDNTQVGATASYAFVPNTAVALGLFASVAAPLSCLQGTICEFLLYDHVFTPTERSDLAGYISLAYGI